MKKLLKLVFAAYEALLSLVSRRSQLLRQSTNFQKKVLAIKWGKQRRILQQQNGNCTRSSDSVVKIDPGSNLTTLATEHASNTLKASVCVTCFNFRLWRITQAYALIIVRIIKCKLHLFI